MKLRALVVLALLFVACAKNEDTAPPQPKMPESVPSPHDDAPAPAPEAAPEAAPAPAGTGE